MLRKKGVTHGPGYAGNGGIMRVSRPRWPPPVIPPLTTYLLFILTHPLRIHKMLTSCLNRKCQGTHAGFNIWHLILGSSRKVGSLGFRWKVWILSSIRRPGSQNISLFQKIKKYKQNQEEIPKKSGRCESSPPMHWQVGQSKHQLSFVTIISTHSSSTSLGDVIYPL